MEERNHQEKSLLVRSQQLHSLLCHRQSLSSSYSRRRNRLFSSLAAILSSRVSSYRYKTFPKETPLATAAPAALSRCVVRISAELAYLFLPFLFGIFV
jgi:tRNA(His) 5'-end guanylyltransferase